MIRKLWYYWSVNRHECDYCTRSAVIRIIARCLTSNMKHRIFACSLHVDAASVRARRLVELGDD